MSGENKSALWQAYKTIEALEAKLAQKKDAAAEPIAIVGMGCRFPGGVKSPGDFWKLLCEGKDATRELPEGRWNRAEWFDADASAEGRMYVDRGGYLSEDVGLFDAEFFGVSPREAAAMDPQQRLVLQVAWHALEDAGIAADGLRESETGVYLGLMTNDYARLQVESQCARHDGQYLGGGTGLGFPAGRLSYILGLQGPSMVVATECSSSLVALHLAANALRAGECGLALAGGVNLILSPEPTVMLSRMRALAADGRSKAFADAADGYGRGEGCGIVVLERLSDAVRNGRRIYAVVHGEATNHDGPSGGLTIPSRPAQEKVIRKALAAAGVRPAQVAYVEAHGTGTALGDPIEVGALASIWKEAGGKLAIGSVKTNIGHLEAAAGVAAVMKTALALHYGVIPASLHCEVPSHHVPWERLPVEVATRTRKWPEGRAFAGVSSFGLSGINAHAVLGKAPEADAKAVRSRRSHSLLVVSGKTAVARDALALRYAELLEAEDAPALSEVCAAAAKGQAQLEYRLAVNAASREEAARLLRNGASAKKVTGRAGQRAEAGTGFLFTGQGAQYAGMGLGLYEAEPVFREALDECAQILKGELEKPLLDVLYPMPGFASPIDETTYTQPALFAVEYALAQMWMYWGIRPRYVAGHSVGEIAAACVAGVMPVADALRFTARRGRMMGGLPLNTGGMAAVFADAGRVHEALRGNDAVAIAAINAPENVVISGRMDVLGETLARLEVMGIASRRLNVSHAFHSAMLDGILPELEKAAREMKLQAPRIRMIAGLTGTWAGAEVATAEYWVRQAREAVRFADGVKAVHAEGCRTFLEIGPKPVLTGLGAATVEDADCKWLASLAQGRADHDAVNQSAAALWVDGFAPNWERFFAGAGSARVALPLYPFEEKRYWIEERRRVSVETAAKGTGLLGSRVESPLKAAQFEAVVSLEREPWLRDHRALGDVLLPAAGYVEMALGAAREEGLAARLADVRVENACRLPEDRELRLQTVVEDGGFSIYSQDEAGQWTRHCAGRIAAGDAGTAEELAEVRRRVSEAVDVEVFYAEARECGVEYGPEFRVLVGLWRGQGEALGRLKEAAHFTAALDGVLQTAGAVTHEERQALIPAAIEGAKWAGGAAMWVHAREAGSTAAGRTFDYTVYDGAGEVVGEIRGMLAVRVDAQPAAHRDWLYAMKWEAAARDSGDCGAELTRLVDASEREARRWMERADLEAYEAERRALDDHARAWIAEALHAVAQQEVAPQHARLFARLKEIADEGVARAKNGLTMKSVALEIVDRCGAALPGVLRGEAEPLKLLFPADGSADATRLYETDLASLATNAMAREALREVVEGLPAGRKIRVLEAGAGTAGTTAHLLGVLPVERAEYRFTDVSQFFMSQARERFRSYGFVRTEVFDIEQDPETQALEAGGFDVVAAANVVHSLEDAAVALEHLHRLVAPGGVLLLIEATRAEAWLDVTFGLTGGWWRFKDGLRKEHPLLGAEEWTSAVRAAGFEEAVAREFGSQGLIVARKARAAEQKRDGLWLVLADGGGVGVGVAARLRRDGCEVLTVENGEALRQMGPDAFVVAGTSSAEVQLFVWERLSRQRLAGVVYLWGLDWRRDERERPEEEVCLPLLSFLRNMALKQMFPPVWVATRGAVEAKAGDAVERFNQAQLWGMANAARLEFPDLAMNCVDLSGESAEGDAACLYAELISDECERHVAYRGQEKLVARLTRAQTDGGPELVRPGGEFVMEAAGKGDLKGLQLRSAERQTPRLGEVEIEVYAAGLNFLDVMDALGALPFERRWLGGECAGVVSAVGSGVTELEVGEEVVALAEGAFGTHAIADARVTVKKPKRLSFAEAAAFPVAYLTADLAFEGVELGPGRRVLIHAVSGGTGMAAARLAKRAGAEVLGTASPGKWERLHSLGFEGLLNSRTAAFGVEASARTHGRGVDVVLNALTHEFIPAGLRALAPGGVFLEIGKTEIWTGEQVRAVREDVSYRPVDLFAYSQRNPEETGKRMRKLARALEDGELEPLPVTEFAVERAVEAFRTLQQAKHVGKIVLTVAARAEIVRGDGAYLIAGGSSGLGQLTAEWLAEKGAQDIVLVSRRISDASLNEAVRGLRERGCRVTTVALDVADRESLARLLDGLKREGRVLRGVVHAAGLLDDGLLTEMEWPRFERVLEPKVRGLWNLHDLTREMKLDFFVAYSSIAAVFGSAGQANHAAANAFVDGLMRWRKAQGLAGLSINWGPWSELGGAARLQGAAKERQRQSGIGTIGTREGMAILDLLWQQTLPQVVVAPVDWERFRLRVGEQPLFAEFVAGRTEPAKAEPVAGPAAGLPGKALHERLDAVIVSELRALLGHGAGWKPDEEQGFFGLGMDSLTSLELRNRLEKMFGIKLPVTLLFDYPTPGRLVEHLGAMLEPVATVNEKQEPGEAGPAAELAVDELAALLEQKLSSMGAVL